MSVIQLGTGGSDLPPTPAADAFSSNLVLALPLNINYGFQDKSSKIRGSGTSYRTNNIRCSLNFDESKFYGSSLLGGPPNSSTQRLFTSTSIPAFGTSDFCIEGWAFIPSIGTIGNLNLFYNHNDTNNGFQVLFLGANPIPPQCIYFGGGAGSDAAHTGASSFPLNQWVHYAVTRQGSTLRIFINGVDSIVFGGTITGNYTGSFEANIANGGDTNYNTIRLQDLRVYQGIAKYTTNFTPPGAMFVY